MSLSRSLLSTGSGFLDRVLCVVGAVLFSQGPEFIQQYLQRLGGHVDEARRQVEQFRHTAEQSGVSLEQLIAQTNANADPAVAKLGGVMSSASERLHHLEGTQSAIAQASVFERPFVFLRHADFDIVQSTWGAFKPAVPTTAEGMMYALVGMIVLLLLYHVAFRIPVSAGYRRWQSNRSTRKLARA
ncbi:DUF2937 domain-containing protein [Opitutaceae bacterium EW11]|nr:DUF2937 domain-containing protein [Opitutaceae bacterium EW11]